VSKLYKERYRIEPTLFSITGWEKIRDALENIKAFHEAMGEVNVSPTDHSGRSIKDTGIVVGKGGKWVGLPWIPRE
jgi:hypothetical protein